MKSQTSSQRTARQPHVPPISQHPIAAPLVKPAQQLRVSNGDLRERITERAYELYAQRGWREGGALEDWLDAEREILSLHLL
jgi:hypothetical protein